MLAFARRQDLNPETLDLVLVVHGMADLLERSLGPSVQIETRFPPIATVRADANQLELALLNLVVNARDAMSEGGSIIIAARQEQHVAEKTDQLAPGDYVCLSVTDNGEGMDEETLARAAEPFFTTKGIGKGTGLGLSMVHGMSEQSGGRLVLKSRRGEGTTAELWLPAAQRTAQDTQSSSRLAEMAGHEPLGHEPHASGSNPQEDGRLVILAVDDDALVLMNTIAMLEDLGHTVFEAASGKEALDVFRREKDIDVVITDQAMPSMTGTQLAGLIRSERRDMPIILATGFAELPPGSTTGLMKLEQALRQEQLARALVAAVQEGSVARGAVRGRTH